MTETGQASWRWGVAWAVASAGLGTAAVLLARTSAPFGTPGLDLGPVPIAVLDTVSITGRTVRAQLDGVVELVDADGTVWLGARGRSFPVELDTGADTLGVAPERRLLVAGHLTGTDGRRSLVADAWTLVEGVAVAADSVRSAPSVDRSDPPLNRSAGAR